MSIKTVLFGLMCYLWGLYSYTKLFWGGKRMKKVKMWAVIRTGNWAIVGNSPNADEMFTTRKLALEYCNPLREAGKLNGMNGIKVIPVEVRYKP